MGRTYLGNSYKIKMYLGNTPIHRMYLGNERIYPNAGMVTYHVDANVTYTEEVDIDESILNPKTFTPSKSGWTFVGWRKDTAANGSVLSNEVMTGDDVTLYAVFRQTITLSYNGNGSTGGSTASQSGTRYYNNGNVANPSFVLRNNGFSKTYYTFTNWAMGSVGGTEYSAGTNVTLGASTIFYAMWTATIVSTTKSGSFTGNISNWMGGSKLIPYGCIYSSNPSVTVASVAPSEMPASAENIGQAAVVASWYSITMSGGSKTINWSAKGNAYQSTSASPIKYVSGSFEAKIENWTGGSKYISFGTTFKTPPKVQTARWTEDLSVSVSNITTSGCTISWGSSTASGGTWTIEWGATGGS